MKKRLEPAAAGERGRQSSRNDRAAGPGRGAREVNSLRHLWGVALGVSGGDLRMFGPRVRPPPHAHPAREATATPGGDERPADPGPGVGPDRAQGGPVDDRPGVGRPGAVAQPGAPGGRRNHPTDRAARFRGRRASCACHNRSRRGQIVAGWSEARLRANDQASAVELDRRVNMGTGRVVGSSLQQAVC